MSGTAVSAIDVAVAAGDWETLGFSVLDDACRVGATALVLGATGAAGTLTGWELRGGEVGGESVDGVPTRWTSAVPAGGAPQHAITATRVDHVVVSTPDVDRTFAALTAAGMTLRRERNAGSTRNPLRQGFFRHGEAIVEVVGPQEPAGDGPASLWGLVVVVADIDAAAELLGARLSTVRDAVQPGRRIATVKPEAIDGLPLALMTELQARRVADRVAGGRALGVGPA